MNYELHSEPQGTDEWKAGRDSRDNASELVLASGDGMNGRTRTDLIRKMATGIEPDGDGFTQKLYDEGHRFEALARPIAEQIIGRDLYPITVSIEVPGLRRRLGASLDGATDDDDTNLEHKRMNAALRAALAQGVIPGEYHWQMEQGQMINGATRTLFMASEWDDDDNLLEEMHVWYESNPVLRDRIIPIWKQAEADAENYQHVEIAEKPKAEVVIELPTLFIQARGEITTSNMKEYGVALAERLATVRSIQLLTDQDFSNAKEAASKFRDQYKKLELVKDAMLAQTTTIGEAALMIDAWREDLRLTALQLEKDVEREDLVKKRKMVADAKTAYQEHINALSIETKPITLNVEHPDFAVALKNKRNYTSMQDSIDTMLANAKIKADSIALDIRTKLAWCKEHAAGYSFLFNDLQTVIYKATDDFQLLVNSRISEHKAAEAKKLEAIKEAARVEAEANAAAKAASDVAAEDAFIAGLWHEARRIEGNSVGYIQKAIGTFECMAPDWENDPRPRVAAAVAECRKEMQEKLTAATAKAEQEEAERQRKASDQPATVAGQTRLDETDVRAGQPGKPVITIDGPFTSDIQIPKPDDGARIRLGEIGDRLGFTVTADFIASLGFQPVETIKAAKLYRESHFKPIVAALIDRLEAVRQRDWRAAA